MDEVEFKSHRGEDIWMSMPSAVESVLFQISALPPDELLYLLEAMLGADESSVLPHVREVVSRILRRLLVEAERLEGPDLQTRQEVAQTIRVEVGRQLRVRKRPMKATVRRKLERALMMIWEGRSEDYIRRRLAPHNKHGRSIERQLNYYGLSALAAQYRNDARMRIAHLSKVVN
jgi:hypothetical protein